MGYPTVMNTIQTVGAGLNVDIQPPITQTWRVTDVGSDLWVGVLPNAVPNINVSLFDGTIQAEFLTAANVRGWYRKQNLVIDNALYLRIANAGLGNANVSTSIELITYFGAGASVSRSAIQTVGAGLTVDIRPATDIEDWTIYDVGSSVWLGAAPVAVPDVEVDLNDGALVARIMDSTETRQWEPEQKLFVTRANYITLTNAGLANANIAWSAELLRYFGGGASIVRSDVQAVGAGLNIDFRPPVGEEWDVTIVGSSAWVGISPAQFPNITVSLFDGTIASTIQTATSWKGNGHALSVKVDRDRYLRVNDASGAGQNVGISAQLTQRYA